VPPYVTRESTPGENRKIAEVGGENDGVFTVNADGSGVLDLTPWEGDQHSPSWSHNGKRIAFASEGDIWTMNEDGGKLEAVADDFYPNGSPSWSPHGNRIAFAGFRPGGSEIYSVKANSGGETDLTNAPGNDESPAWSPDGRTIAYTKAPAYRPPDDLPHGL